jgi:aminoglycoside phosphotransferase (APT) family kinase protein
VLDWEMSTPGDPLIADGFWSREQLVDAYAQATTGPLDHLQACLGPACLKLAVVMESIHYRHLSGQALDPLSAGQKDATPALLEMGLAVASSAGTGVAGLAV